MAMIFPRMDPYLEDSHGWQGFQTSFVVYLAASLQADLRPRYVAAVNVRTFREWLMPDPTRAIE